MAASKPLASLSSGLLARPGQAKPAMRPQAFSYAPTEDLGWNDLGHHQQPATVAAVEPAPAPAPEVVPPVLAERAKLAEVVAPTPKAERPARKVPAPRPATGRKAAFTLRLDGDRHLRLRLASAVAGRSSQQLVVEALDAFLNAQPEVEALARQVPGGATTTFSGEK